MKLCKLLVLLTVISSVPAFAGRVLIVPSMRLRGDAAGSNAGSGLSIQYPHGPTSTPIKVFEIRYRFEFTNISATDSQHVTVYLRPGSRVGARTSRFAYAPYEVIGVSPQASYASSRVKIADFVLGAFSNSSVDHSAGVYLSFTCDIAATTPNCTTGSAVVKLDPSTNSDVPTSQSLPSGFLAISDISALKDIMERDPMLELVGNFDVEVAEDKGAVVGTVGAITNRVGGYAQVLQQSSGNIALNGGRPF